MILSLSGFLEFKMSSLKIAGFWSGHDCSSCVLEDGYPLLHVELERYIREKEPSGDALALLQSTYSKDVFNEIDYFASSFPLSLIENTKAGKELIELINTKRQKKIYCFNHHQCHAANAFFSSNHHKALVLTIDGGGIVSRDGDVSATTSWYGEGKHLTNIETLNANTMNVGGLWTRVTRYIFRLQNGWPRGHQAGTVMAMAALGDPHRYINDFRKMLTTDLLHASMKPQNQPKGAYIPGNDPIHPYLNHWADIAAKNNQEMYDLAAGLQAATEEQIRQFIEKNLSKVDVDSICIAGGVALNSVMIGKINKWFPKIKNVYVPPVPYDGGLSIGAAQIVYHNVLNNERLHWDDCFPAYMGEIHKKIPHYLYTRDDIVTRPVTETEVVERLISGEIIAVYRGSTESGRRALGNRSIIADPRSSLMKSKINDKVKHRQWFRPFAPSILREEMKNWFEEEVESPYMTHVVKFKDDVISKVPAVVHFDGTGRVQTVTEKHNHWYYHFIKRFQSMTGVPILLNTSFNDSSPIILTPKDAIECFLSTEIDCVYFVDDGFLVTRK